MGEKRLADAYTLGIPFGLFGAHHFYLGRKYFGILYLCTLGLFGIGYIYDLIRMRWLVRHANRYGTERNMITDCYLLVSIGGLFGIHHYYLGNWKLGLLYTFTLGIFGIGWIVDLFHVSGLVKASNDKTSDHGMTIITAYVLCISPLGLFGAHHFYLKRYLNGGLYVATFGLFGIGWIFDMLRLPVLYERYASEDKHKYVDEAYLFWFPFGLFGLHRFYMGETKWGILYALTFGCLGIGWLIDGFHLPSMIDDFNKTVRKSDLVEFRIYRNKNEVAETEERCDMCETDDSFHFSE